MTEVDPNNVIPLHWIETEKRDSLKPPSRFQVAKVDFDVENKNRVVADDRNEDGAYQLQLTHNSNYSNSYDTHNLKSLGQYTREALPRLDHYRNILSLHGHISRPTLDELHNGNCSVVGDPNWQKPSEKLEKYPEDQTLRKQPTKFGWIQGVLVRCLLNIWGVMLFLRLSWVVGQSGIGLSIAIVLLAGVVTVVTSLSMSAICTNGEVKGGGTYYMISRSLGPEFGGSIGLIFSLANAVAVAMYVVGFAETVTDLMLEQSSQITDDKMNDMRIISCATVVVLLGIAIIGTEWESKAQIVLLIILLGAMVNFIIGSFLPPSQLQISQGFIGWSGNLGMKNFFPEFRSETFFSVFAVFFPAATGILAGANISGDLKDPQKAIPKGTLLAIFITTISYILFAVTAGCTVFRDANGIEEFGANGTHLITNCTLSVDGICKYGLMNYFQSMKLVAAFDPLIYAGIFAATLSSALASLVSAPKVFQALCKDGIFPYIHVFAKGYGKNGEPRRGYVLTFAIAIAFCAIGELNSIAPIISNFFLAAYCLINFSCFHASFSRSPGFRPSFKYYNMWLSLLGAILCLIVMFVTNWWAALATFAVVLALFIYIYYRKPDVNWGSSTQAQMYQTALNAVVKLNLVPDHVKNYRPQILILTGDPSSRPPLVDFAYMISKKLGLTICGNVLTEYHSHKSRAIMTQQAYHWLQKRKVKAFYGLVQESSFSHGVRSLIQLTGLGKLRPNAILMGYKSNWQDCSPTEVLEYFNVIHDAFDMHMSLGILRVREGLDYSEYANADELAVPIRNEKNSFLPFHQTADNFIGHNVSCSQLSQAESSRESSPPSSPTTQRSQKSDGISHNPLGHSPSMTSNNTQSVKDTLKIIPKEVLLSANQFQRKQKKGTIDVWWLYDDGGLTMLFPYLLTTRSQWSSCKLRIFSLANKKDELDREQRNMAALLSKFRIDYSDVTVIPDVIKPPQDSSKQEFQEIIKKWKENKLSNEENPELCITESELLALKDKNNRHMRLRELLLQHSKEASLIVMTLPMPRKSTCSAPLYMAWLETLTRNMPPFLLIRGNQTSVLTFYS